MVLFPTISCSELGKETDHQVRASARSEGQVVQLQQRQLRAIAKDEVVEVDKAVVGFGLRVSLGLETGPSTPR